MNEAWVRTNLVNLIKDDRIIYATNQWIPIDAFVTLFQTVTTPSHATLRTALATNSGWSAIFDTWHSEGILK